MAPESTEGLTILSKSRAGPEVEGLTSLMRIT